MIPTGLLFDPAFLSHRQGDLVYVVPHGTLNLGEHFDSPLRLAYTKQLLDAVGMTERLTRVAFARATDEQLLRVHRPEYLRQLAEACAVAGEQVVRLGDDAAGSASTEDVARLAAGAACAAVDAVMTGPLRQAYALIRPSGHHAGADFAMGYCYYNNVAIAARHAQAAHGVERVAIVDWDVHHGNGTQQTFYDDPSVLFVSLHEAANFPVDGGEARETGGGAGAGYNANVPLPSGTGDAGYRHAFDELVLPLVEAFAPQLILVSAGQDANAFDPLGRMRVQRDGFRHMARALRQAAGGACGGRIVMLQEGGYSLPYLPIATLGVLEGLVGWNAPFDDPHQFVQYPLGEGERAAVKAARAALAPYWPTLHRS
ncbi:histone deacetylase [Burkholderia pseudomallei]|uniref:histone deacetylase n=1 Tax=Burkholderia TaxID=32008 RepID=UPI0003497033|nr:MULTISPECIES: histone deacetylase [Burkholderia]AIP48516.1 histone deacetylase-like amidohydrolase [Burkholderia pseudomallei MSHR5858]AYX30060.1 class II histone deacetylase [Burkholderia pseudomallei]KGV14369.1 histone deacetylase-like amidohydrolase [Burkholderia pseudomallei MSHR4300]KGX21809.1 histone deacetylase-like amidohydrolase [Burkholderia pseudomallei]KGX28423.1 histone deacetylase-like amidohydrolase [Burkholderia pseudomallei]